jgi:hypothetical protein
LLRMTADIVTLSGAKGLNSHVRGLLRDDDFAFPGQGVASISVFLTFKTSFYKHKAGVKLFIKKYAVIVMKTVLIFDRDSSLRSE